ncbi:MAG: glutathione S-transferase family protein, partial [Hyphomicrobiaceae bacterium]|nr:glutathione S-transferase family protein [Hyphomicrobiaceae bacterium]
MILMRAKKVEFDVTYVNLRDKPEWFLKLSPHGKVPVLQVGDEVLFESNAIAEFLDETVAPRLHPEDPVKRARNRAWTDFVPTFAAAMGGVTYAADKAAVEDGVAKLAGPLARLEAALATERKGDGPYFNGGALSLVDAAYAPFLQRFTICESVLKTGLLAGYPRVQAWAAALLADTRVTSA